MKNKRQHYAILRWIARIWGSLLLVFLLIMVSGELVEHLSGEPRFFIDSVSDLIGLLFFPMFCIGIGIAWKWEGLGRLIIIGAIIMTQIGVGRLSIGLSMGLFASSGLLFIIYWFLSKAKQ